MCLAIAVSAVPAVAQSTADASPGIIPAGGEMDNYLRYLQTLGRVGAHPWSLRAFSTTDARHLEHPTGVHPWSGQALFDSTSSVERHMLVLPPRMKLRYNTAYPFGSNDGPVWAGRGATISASAGIMLNAGILHVVLAPTGFLAQNRAFAVQSTASGPVLNFADPDFPTQIDRPQRFGSKSYGRIDPGESGVRVDTRFVSVGATTANQYWGPATTFPFILGNNAPGIPHIFVGTGIPVSIVIGELQARVSYGIEHQSAFSPVTGGDTFTSVTEPGKLRIMSGLVVTYQPRGLPTLELGAVRFFHDAWTGHVTRANLTAPFSGGGAALGSASPEGADPSRNQLASLFFRWVFPHSGAEVYGEYGREDRYVNTRDLEAEPDHSRSAMLGIRKALIASADQLLGVRAELIDATEPTLARHRGEGAIYMHTVLRQGHTYEGQVLGAPIGVGSAAGAVLALDRYTRSGLTSFYVERTAQDNIGTFYVGGPARRGAPSIDGTVGVRRMTFRGPVTVITGVAANYRTRPFGGARGWNAELTAGLSLHP